MKHTICMVSDFFYPSMGGVEEHIFQLSQCLIARGHKVIVVTHSYGDRCGIRYMTNGLKVYYLPIKQFYNQAVLPTFFSVLPLLRCVLIREDVMIVHGHSAFSTMAHETMSLGRALGLKAVFTDHSLFGFADVSAIITNNFLSLSLADVNHCICVSYVGKENTVLRANVPKENVSVIPNAIDVDLFKPDPDRAVQDRIIIVLMSRLQYRKGVDLQPSIIRTICREFPQVDFIIGGDGPKRSLLEEVRDEVGHSRVHLLGAVPHAEVHSILVQGHIFLNTSLTEAFCIAICEAAASGLQVVSTRVGGIPEVLPPHLIILAEANSASLSAALKVAISREIDGTRLPPWDIHNEMKGLYNWFDVAQKTELVYDKIMQDSSRNSLIKRIRKLRKCDVLTGTFMIFLIIIQHFLLLLCEYFRPASAMDRPPCLSSILLAKSSVIDENKGKRE